jgi:hypothetical protein
MNTATTDLAQLNWDDVRGVCFFRITARIFSSQFCFGASTLLGTCDDIRQASLPDHRSFPRDECHAVRPSCPR